MSNKSYNIGEKFLTAYKNDSWIWFTSFCILNSQRPRTQLTKNFSQRKKLLSKQLHRPITLMRRPSPRPALWKRDFTMSRGKGVWMGCQIRNGSYTSSWSLLALTTSTSDTIQLKTKSKGAILMKRPIWPFLSMRCPGGAQIGQRSCWSQVGSLRTFLDGGPP